MSEVGHRRSDVRLKLLPSFLIHISPVWENLVLDGVTSMINHRTFGIPSSPGKFLPSFYLRLLTSDDRLLTSEASVADFSPVTFSAQNHLTSELLRTL